MTVRLAVVRRLRRLASESGVATVELVGMIPLLFLAALAAWQILLGAYTLTQAENAARAASRAAGMGHDEEQAARAALPRSLSDGVTTTLRGKERAVVRVEVPIIAGPLKLDGLAVTRSAELPNTD